MFLVVDAVIWPMLTMLLVVKRVSGSTAGVLIVSHLVGWSFPQMFFAGLVHGPSNVRSFLVPGISIYF